MSKNINEIDFPLSKEVAKQAVKKIKLIETIKKNWRFVAICTTILLCVAMVCGTVYAITCHISTIDAIKEIAYATEIVTESSTVEQDTGEGGDNYYQTGNNNAIGGE